MSGLAQYYTNEAEQDVFLYMETTQLDFAEHQQIC